MSKKQMSFYIDKDLARKFNIKCASEDKKKSSVIIELIRKWLS